MGNDQDNTERIAKLEQKVDTTFEWFKDVLVRIESKLDLISEKYVTKELFNQITENIQRQVTDLKLEKKETRRMLPDIIMACSAIISLGLTLYLMFHK